MIAEYDQVIEQSSTPPRWTRSNIYLGWRLLATVAPIPQQPGITVVYHHPDRLGTRRITNAMDGGQGIQATLPFGTVLSAESTVEINPRFTSYDRSAATGLDYAVNRFYDPEYSRFTQADPLGQAASSPANPQSLNLYSYVGNDPVNAVDPTGLEAPPSPDATCTTRPDGTPVCTAYGRTTVEVIPPSGAQPPPKKASSSPQYNWPGPLGGWPGAAGSNSGPAGSSPGAGGGGSGTTVGESKPISLQEAIYRGLGGKGPYVPPPRQPTSQLDLLFSGYLTVTGGVLAAGFIGLAVGAEATLTGLYAAAARGVATLVRTGTVVGTALLNSDAFHRAAAIVGGTLSEGFPFLIRGGDGVVRTLVQVEGELNGDPGRYEWIIEDLEFITHQMFVRGGTINGIPIKP